MNHIGETINGLLCKERIGTDKSGHIKYKFIDKKGNEYIKEFNKAVIWKDKLSKIVSNRENEIGKTYNNLTVIKYIKSEKKHAYYKCKCSCGNELIARLDDVKSGHKKCCGCVVEERKKKNIELKAQKKIQHDLEIEKRKQERKIYKQTHKSEIERHKILSDCWRRMHYRCEKPTYHKYKDYGARGIKVCNEWKEYKPFEQWAINNGWQKGLSIDRINNDGVYEPNNCRWTTVKVQNNNTRRNKIKNYLLANK